MANKNKHKNNHKNAQKTPPKERRNWKKIISTGVMSFMALILLLSMFVPYMQ